MNRMMVNTSAYAYKEGRSTKYGDIGNYHIVYKNNELYLG